MAPVIVLDASTLIAWMESTDAFHPDAVRLLADATGAGEGLAVHSVTLAELLVGNVRAGDEEQAYQDMTSAGIAVVDAPGDLWPVHLARVRQHSGLKTPDAIVLATATALGATVATFDDRLGDVALAAGVRYTSPT